MNIFLKIVLVIVATIILFFSFMIIWARIEHSGLDKIIFQTYEGMNLDSLAVIEIKNSYRIYIDEKPSNVDFVIQDINEACQKRKNDSILLLKYEDQVSTPFINEILLLVKKSGKKVIIDK